MFLFVKIKKYYCLHFPTFKKNIFKLPCKHPNHSSCQCDFLIIAGLEQLGYEHHISTQGPYLSTPPPRPVDSDPKSKGALKINIKIFFALFV